MHDDRREGVHGSNATMGTDERDTLAALISAAGKRPTPPDTAYEQVFSAAHDAWQAKIRARRTQTRRFALAASVAIVALGAAVIVELVPRPSTVVFASADVIQGDVVSRASASSAWQPLDSLETPIVVGTQIRTTDNGRIGLTLPDGGSLRIDVASEITIGGTTEIDLVAGTLYLDSGDAMLDEPFAITTPLGTVRDIGTQFELATEPETLRVRVRDGAVSITGSGAPVGVLGSAGEQIRLVADGTVERDAFSPFDPAWSWVQSLAGSMDIEGQSLLAFLDWVARETGRELRFDEPLTETRARGVILHGDAATLLPMEALDVVLATTDFAYALRDDGAIVVSMRTQ